MTKSLYPPVSDKSKELVKECGEKILAIFSAHHRILLKEKFAVTSHLMHLAAAIEKEIKNKNDHNKKN